MPVPATVWISDRRLVGVHHHVSLRGGAFVACECRAQNRQRSACSHATSAGGVRAACGRTRGTKTRYDRVPSAQVNVPACIVGSATSRARERRRDPGRLRPATLAKPVPAPGCRERARETARGAGARAGSQIHAGATAAMAPALSESAASHGVAHRLPQGVGNQLVFLEGPARAWPFAQHRLVRCRRPPGRRGNQCRTKARGTVGRRPPALAGRP